MKQTTILVLIAILLVPFVSAIIPFVNGDCDGNTAPGVPDYDGLAAILAGDINLCQNSMDVNGDGKDFNNIDCGVNNNINCGIFDLEALAGITASCTDNDHDYYYTCPNTVQLKSNFDGVKDCNDDDNTISPGLVETYDGIKDNDCSGADFVLTGTVNDGTNNLYNAQVDIVCSTLLKSGFSNDQLQVGYYYIDQLNDPKQNCNTQINKAGFLSYSSSNYNIGTEIKQDNVILPENTAITGKISGNVKDDSNNPLPGATVYLIKESNNEIVQIVKSDGFGNYLILGVPAGPTYKLIAELPTYSLLFGPTGVSFNIGDNKIVGSIFMKQ